MTCVRIGVGPLLLLSFAETTLLPHEGHRVGVALLHAPIESVTLFKRGTARFQRAVHFSLRRERSLGSPVRFSLPSAILSRGLPSRRRVHKRPSPRV